MQRTVACRVACKGRRLAGQPVFSRMLPASAAPSHRPPQWLEHVFWLQGCRCCSPLVHDSRQRLGLHLLLLAVCEPSCGGHPRPYWAADVLLVVDEVILQSLLQGGELPVLHCCCAAAVVRLQSIAATQRPAYTGSIQL